MDYESFKGNTTIVRPLPNGVSYDLSDRDCTTITLPPRSTWSSELHWHEKHTEYLRVVKGSVRVRLGSRTFSITAPKPGEPAAVVTVERYVRHEWYRADRDLAASEKDEEEVIVVESTDPNDAEKHVFFWNINGVILDAQHKAVNLHEGLAASLTSFWLDLMVTLKLFIIFAVLDNYPAFLDIEQSRYKILNTRLGYTLQRGLTHVVFRVAVLVGEFMRFEAVDDRYTPRDLMRQWRESATNNDRKSI